MVVYDVRKNEITLHSKNYEHRIMLYFQMEIMYGINMDNSLDDRSIFMVADTRKLVDS